jgi:branched-chain amino acid transport system substrate-binding protein
MRKLLVFVVLGVLVALTVPAVALAGSAKATEVIKIGHIRPLTGNMALTSQRMVKAFNWAFAQAGYKVAGHKIQIVGGDSQGDPATAVDVARKMVERDHVAMIVGPTQGGEQMAVAAYCTSVGVPVMFTNPEPLAATTPGFPWVIGGYGTEPQLSSAMGLYAYKKLGYRTVDVLSNDFAPGHTFPAAFIKTFKAQGGTIAKETYAPYPTNDWSSYLTVQPTANALAAWTDGANSVKFLTQYYQMKLKAKLPLIGIFHGSFLAPFILSALPAKVSNYYLGCLIPVPYSPLLNTTVNKKFVAAFQKKFKSLPEDTDSGPYVGAQIILHALRATKGDTTPAKLRDAIVAVNFAGPEGPIKFDKATRSAIKTVYISKVAKQGKAFVWKPVFTYKNVPAAGL